MRDLHWKPLIEFCETLYRENVVMKRMLLTRETSWTAFQDEVADPELCRDVHERFAVLYLALEQEKDFRNALSILLAQDQTKKPN